MGTVHPVHHRREVCFSHPVPSPTSRPASVPVSWSPIGLEEEREGGEREGGEGGGGGRGRGGGEGRRRGETNGEKREREEKRQIFEEQQLMKIKHSVHV